MGLKRPPKARAATADVMDLERPNQIAQTIPETIPIIKVLFRPILSLIQAQNIALVNSEKVKMAMSTPA